MQVFIVDIDYHPQNPLMQLNCFPHEMMFFVSLYGRTDLMFISEEAGTASCPCGAIINLSIDSSNQNSAQNSQESYDHTFTSPSSSSGGARFSNRNNVISAEELKRRLGSVHDR